VIARCGRRGGPACAHASAAAPSVPTLRTRRAGWRRVLASARSPRDEARDVERARHGASLARRSATRASPSGTACSLRAVPASSSSSSSACEAVRNTLSPSRGIAFDYRRRHQPAAFAASCVRAPATRCPFDPYYRNSSEPSSPLRFLVLCLHSSRGWAASRSGSSRAVRRVRPGDRRGPHVPGAVVGAAPSAGPRVQPLFVRGADREA